MSTSKSMDRSVHSAEILNAAIVGDHKVELRLRVAHDVGLQGGLGGRQVHGRQCKFFVGRA
jgi:hypothetical protein